MQISWEESFLSEWKIPSFATDLSRASRLSFIVMSHHVTGVAWRGKLLADLV